MVPISAGGGGSRGSGPGGGTSAANAGLDGAVVGPLGERARASSRSSAGGAKQAGFTTDSGGMGSPACMGEDAHEGVTEERRAPA